MDTVAKIIEEVSAEMCESYCKYRDIKSEDDTIAEALKHICEGCPLNKLGFT